MRYPTTLEAATAAVDERLARLHDLAGELGVGLELQHAMTDDGYRLWRVTVEHSGSPDRGAYVPGGDMPVQFTTWTTAGSALLPVLAMARKHLADLETAQAAAYEADPEGRLIGAGYERQAVLAVPGEAPATPEAVTLPAPTLDGVVTHEALSDDEVSSGRLGYTCQCGHNSLRHAIVTVRGHEQSTYLCQAPGCGCTDVREDSTEPVAAHEAVAVTDEADLL